MEHVRCNLCGADDTVIRFPSTLPEEDGRPADPEHFMCTTLSYGEHYRIVQCRQCGMNAISPTATPVPRPFDAISVPWSR